MKKILFITLISFVLITSCTELDLNPLSEGSSENWYSDEIEITLSLNDLYREYLWDLELNFQTDRWTDDWNQRQYSYDFSAGTITSEWSQAEDTWLNTYKGISRANTIINNLSNAEGNIVEDMITRMKAEACFFRACFYAKLIALWGDVPFYTETLSIDEAFDIGRTDKNTILQQVYEDFDFAAQNLPLDYGAAELKRVTKGAALAMKARTALWMSDWEVVRDAALACMELDKYSLYPNYREYFLSKNKNLQETIFALPRAYELGFGWNTKNFITRTAGGNAVANPSWELFCAFPCTDGLPIDESPLYDPRNPFLNRDPRCAEMIVPFGTEHLGFIYEPHPDSLWVLNVNTGQKVKNLDTRGYTPHCSYNGLVTRKWQDLEWTDDQYTSMNIIIMRYADVLLMYAEAKIELNEIDQSVLDAINKVRARAYKVDYTATGDYPAVTTTNQSELRKQIRLERRVELAWEHRRWWDLIRWRLAEKVLTKPVYGLLGVNDLRTKVVNAGLWFFPGIPEIDEDGVMDFSAMHAAGTIAILSERNFSTRQYLWPIPNKEILINDNLEQNSGY